MFRAAHGSSTTRADLTLELSVQPEKCVSLCACWFICSQLIMSELCIYLNSMLSKGFIIVLGFHNQDTSDTSFEPQVSVKHGVSMAELQTVVMQQKKKATSVLTVACAALTPTATNRMRYCVPPCWVLIWVYLYI